METVNAIIKSATIDDADRGVLTAWVHLEYGHSVQGFGGVALYWPRNFAHHQLLSPAGHFIWRVMEVAGVTNWKDVAGKSVRVQRECGIAMAIGHIVKDDWFNPTEDFKEAEDG